MSTRDSIIPSALGELTVVAEGNALVGLYFAEHRRRPAVAELGTRVDPEVDPLFAEATRQIEQYLLREREDFELPLRTAADPSSEQVWARLREIPYGETTTYGAIARALGRPDRAQAVGAAVGRNPLCLLIPCHRVLGADGSLTGYAGGLDRKGALMDLELLGLTPRQPVT